MFQISPMVNPRIVDRVKFLIDASTRLSRMKYIKKNTKKKTKKGIEDKEDGDSGGWGWMGKDGKGTQMFPSSTAIDSKTINTTNDRNYYDLSMRLLIVPID